MIATAGYQYEYNAAGGRVSKDNSAGAPQTLYLHDGEGNQIGELNAALAVQHVNVYSGKRLVGTWNPSTGQVYYAYADWLGTKRYEADGAGGYVNSWASLPFGDNQTALGTGADATEHHFTDQEHDGESGLDHFNARYYQSQKGRWLLPDWSATPVAVPYATFTNPQSLNLYTYVGNNPVNAVDADGHLDNKSSSTVGNPFVRAECGRVDVDGSVSDCGVDDGAVPDGATEAYQAYLAEVADTRNSDANAEQTQQQLSDKSESAILNSNLNGAQAIAFENAVVSAGSTYGINPNVLVGMAMKESSLDPTATTENGSASGLFGITDGTKSAYGLSSADATGTSPSSITRQVNTAAHYLSDLTHGSVPSGHPDHKLEIALGYYRGSRKGVNGAMGSKGGYNSMLKLSYGGETLGHYIKFVEAYQ